MDYSFFIWSTATYIEARLKEEIDYSCLERTIGFSYRHIRETFKECTDISLSRYILMRRIANAAFEIIHTNKSLLDISGEYTFYNYDSFTRAFKRCTKITPSEFRTKGCRVGRYRFLMGMYAPVILEENEDILLSNSIREVENIMRNREKTDNSCILYGVPKVAYSFEECTPFPTALKACLNYMGQEIDYSYIMATSGAAFRLRWNINYWDGGNVDIMNIYEDKYEAFKRAFKAAGRTYKILKRENASRKDFIEFIKVEIDQGRPVIALGIIGPPEACLITGYQNNGETLLGWNCFQENREFRKDIKIHESGYFICNTWWENPATIAVMAVGEEQNQPMDAKNIIEDAIRIMTTEKICYESTDRDKRIEYAGGQAAYDAWSNAISDNNEFPNDAILPLLFERMMCQGDAQVMVGEGRSYAACYISWVGNNNEIIADECEQVATLFREEAQCAFKMNEVKGGFMQDEQATRIFAKPDVRKQIVLLINKAKEYDAKACTILKEILTKFK
ncbi:hypothetical protein AN1V17_36940 [Vallitalea sediminicola]